MVKKLRVKMYVKLWTVCDARGFESETPHFFWIRLRLSTIHVQNLYNFPVKDLKGCHRLPLWKNDNKTTNGA